MHWANKWVGLPYDPVGRGPQVYDCYGLFLALMKERQGIELPDPRATLLMAVRDELAKKMRQQFRPVEEAEEGDAVLFRTRGQLLHVGYAIDHRDMLHTSDVVGTSTIERFTLQRWATLLEGIYRYER